MSNDFQDWIRTKGIGEVECLIPDMNGIIRGKVLPAQKFLQTVRDGDWRAHTVQFSIGGRPVGTATYQSAEAA